MGINNNVNVSCFEMNQSQGMIQIISVLSGEWIYLFTYYFAQYSLKIVNFKEILGPKQK